MRIHLKTTNTNELIPFNYQNILTGALHKWIGVNEVHGSLSLYSFSWLNGGKAIKGGLSFENGAYFFISVHDHVLLKQIIKGVRDFPEISNGLVVKEIIIQDSPRFGGIHTFMAASPILIKRSIDGHEKHFDFNDKESSVLLTETLKNKLRKAGMDDNDVLVEFDRNFKNPKTKVIYYNKIGNKVNFCPIIVKGSSEQVQFAWDVGIGNSTGIGFGAIK